MDRLAVAAWACRERGQKVYFGEEFEEISRAHRARFHEVAMGTALEAGAHEHVKHVMDMSLRFAWRELHPLRQRPGQVRMAAMVIVAAGQEAARVGVAAGADHIMNPGAVGVEAVPAERIVGDRRQRPQIGQRAPEPRPDGHMRRIEGARLAAEETLCESGWVPQVEIADLRPLDAD